MITLNQIAAMPWFNELPSTECIGWRDVSKGQLSIARFYGELRVNGHAYVYIAPADELIRWDIYRRAVEWQQKQDENSKESRVDTTPDLFAAPQD